MTLTMNEVMVWIGDQCKARNCYTYEYVEQMRECAFNLRRNGFTIEEIELCLRQSFFNESPSKADIARAFGVSIYA